MNKVLQKLGINKNEFISYGNDKGKVKLSILNRLNNKQDGKLVLVTAINPTKAGEGKTTVSIGLAQGLNALGERVCLALREPSLGPVFGLKGGATGGGKSVLTPAEDINLHFTGDFHAITSANNLLSSLIDAHMYYGNELKIKDVVWPRTMDMNDRFLRNIETKLRKDNFIITAASEIMAILALSTSLKDLKERLSNILVGYNENNEPIYAKQIGAVDAMTILLKDAIHPNLVQTIDGVPAFVHCGPFANIAHGCNSVLATKMALKLSNYTITEAGFGADLGMEKFLDLKRPILGKNPDVVCLVVTLRALKAHGEANDYSSNDIIALNKGIEHLKQHIENIRKFNLPFVIALNHFENDDSLEVGYLLDWAKTEGHKIAVSKGFKEGKEGTKELAKLIMEASEHEELEQVFMYDHTDSIVEKIEKIATKIYRAKNVSYSKKALKKLDSMKDLNHLSVCIAKTPMSFSGDASLVGTPRDFTLEIDDFNISHGAGFVVAKTKGIMVMPGLNNDPNAKHMKIDDEGNFNLF